MPSLKAFNTFGVDVQATSIQVIHKRKDLEDLNFDSPDAYFILGGGSNILLTQDIDVPVLKNEIKGKRIVQQSAGEVWVQIGGGENWHETVIWTLDQGFSGLENLSLIPGTVGASPIQNIGAYGVELQDVFYQLTAYNLLTKELVTFAKDDCEFGYRSSIFKKPENKGVYFITHVTLKLSKNVDQVNMSYGAIKQVLQEKGIASPKAKDISNAVIEIRESKLPDPNVLGNSGSFFKNPIVSKEQFLSIQKEYPKMPFYEVGTDHIKIPAGWLIEMCGLKGKRFGQTGSYEKQALIIVNYGSASGQEIYEHAIRVKKYVQDKFGIELSSEVNIL